MFQHKNQQNHGHTVEEIAQKISFTVAVVRQG